MINQPIVLAFLFAITTSVVIFLAYKLTMYLYGIFGIMAVLCLIGFSTLWVVWYLILSE